MVTSDRKELTMDLDGYLNLSEDQLRVVGSKKWTAYPDSIGAFVAEMDFGTAPPIINALVEAIHTQSFGYLPASLSTRMSVACARWYADSFGWEVDASWIHPGPDVLGLLQYTIDHLADVDKPIIVLTPTYAPFLQISQASGRRVIEVPLSNDDGRYRIDLDALAAAFAESDGGLLLLTNPQNPVGRVFTRAELTDISVIVDAHGGRVFADEIHAPIVFSGASHVPYASISACAAEHAVTAVSASKGWNLAGLKCAQIILTRQADRDEWTETGYLTMHAASVLGVLANAVAYESGMPWVREVVGALEENRNALQELVRTQLPEVTFHAPEGTYLAWLDCRSLSIDQPAVFFRQNSRVALVDGADCGGTGAGFVRLNFAMPPAITTTAIDRMCKALNSR